MCVDIVFPKSITRIERRHFRFDRCNLMQTLDLQVHPARLAFALTAMDLSTAISVKVT
jgi:hypothetical protein